MYMYTDIHLLLILFYLYIGIAPDYKRDGCGFDSGQLIIFLILLW